MRASRRIERVQIVLPPSRRPDTYKAEFVGWSQPLVRYARRIIFQLTEVGVTRKLFSKFHQKGNMRQVLIALLVFFLSGHSIS